MGFPTNLIIPALFFLALLPAFPATGPLLPAFFALKVLLPAVFSTGCVLSALSVLWTLLLALLILAFFATGPSYYLVLFYQGLATNLPAI